MLRVFNAHREEHESAVSAMAVLAPYRWSGALGKRFGLILIIMIGVNGSSFVEALT